jgi:DNA transformation protein
MPVTPEYRAFVLEQLGRVTPVTSRSMFGGVGVYADGLIFALMDDDTTYLKVGDANRADFEARGMRPFRPYGDDGPASLNYSELPADLLDDVDALRPWVEKAIDVSRAARRKKKR